jgi:hypothetical protein
MADSPPIAVEDAGKADDFGGTPAVVSVADARTVIIEL